MMKRWSIFALVLAAVTAGGCTSHLVPLRPTQQVQEWVPDAATASAPATAAAATTPATAPAAATQPGHMVERTIDPNRSVRFIYNASYDNVWKQAQEILSQMGFAIDRDDYRLGVMTTHPLPSSQIVEFWKPQQVDAIDALENTVNNQRRWITLTISTVEGKPAFYEIGVQVIVERQTNPSETLAKGPIFVEGSAFGRNAITLQSDYAPAVQTEKSTWGIVGHDPDLEKKILDALFKRI